MNVRLITACAVLVGTLMGPATADEPATQKAPQPQPTPAERLIAAEKTAVAAVEKAQGINHIDWTRGYLIAAGTAKVAGKTEQDIAMARRAARILAIRNAAVLAAGVHIGPDGRADPVKSGNISATLQVRGMEELSAVHNPHAATFTLRVRVPLYGVNGIIGISGVQPQPIRRRINLGRSGRAFRMLVIDARGSGFRPSLAPRVTDESRNVLFSAADFPGKAFGGRGVLNYVVMPSPRKSAFDPIQRARDISALAGRAEPVLQKAAARAFTSALLLRANKSPGAANGILVLDRRSVTNLLAAGNGRKLFEQGKIVVVIDAP